MDNIVNEISLAAGYVNGNEARPDAVVIVPVVTIMEAHFEGIMTYPNQMAIVELHTVKGDLFYNRDY